jgi:hypothetical protein
MADNNATQLRRVKAMRVLILACCFVALLMTASYADSDAAKKQSRLYLPVMKATTSVTGDQVDQYLPVARGKKGRKYVRFFSLGANLVGDKLMAYETYGYTPHRLRVLSLGRVTERWRYYSLGLELTFDENGALISSDTFPPQSGHID